jgi:hypothetical protein
LLIFYSISVFSGFPAVSHTQLNILHQCSWPMVPASGAVQWC